MLCKECSAELPPNARFCAGCSAVVALPVAAPPVGVPQVSPIAKDATAAEEAPASGRRGLFSRLVHSRHPTVAERVKDGSGDSSTHSEVSYDSEGWDSEEFAAITAALDVRDVAWYSDDGSIVVAARHELLVDNVVRSVTGKDPNIEVDLEPEAYADFVSDEEFAESALDYGTGDWSPLVFSEVTTALDTAGIRWTMVDGFLLVSEDDEKIVDRIILSVTGDQPL